MSQYDLTVIGAGPGGYVCAIRAAQLGLKVAIVEKEAAPGGTCLNIGCIPSKALLHASEVYHEAKHSFSKLGVLVDPSFDLSGMMKHKTDTVNANVSGIEFLFKKNKIDVHHGIGSISKGAVIVTDDHGAITEIASKNIVIATGSVSSDLPGIAVDEEKIVSSTGALSLSKVPEKLLVVGAGVIGLELGSVWARLGSKVTVVEYMDRILPGMDGEVAKQFQRTLRRQGFVFNLGSKVTQISDAGSGLEAKIEPASGGDAEVLSCDVALIAVGRRPFTAGLGLEEMGVELDKRGRISTDGSFKTSVEGIYAIGDAIAGPMLAHKAEEEGVALAELLAGQSGHVNYDVIPGVVYTSPEVASIGKTEDELKESGATYRVGKFPFTANGRAKSMLRTEGFVKVLADADTDRVLGAHIIGPSAGELIHEIAVLMEFGGSAEDLARTCHAHPTLSEAVKEAALAVDKRPIHI